MDPAIIGYSKQRKNSLDLNETYFGAYFIGSKNNENRNTKNVIKNDNNNGHKNQIEKKIQINNGCNKSVLTPLNTNTALKAFPISRSTSPAKHNNKSASKAHGLYEIPKKHRITDVSSFNDVRSLPSLPNTPSPPRNKKRYQSKDYYKKINQLNYNQQQQQLDGPNNVDPYYYDPNNAYNSSNSYYNNGYINSNNSNYSNNQYYYNDDYYNENNSYYSNNINNNLSIYPNHGSSCRSNSYFSRASYRSNSISNQMNNNQINQSTNSMQTHSNDRMSRNNKPPRFHIDYSNKAPRFYNEPSCNIKRYTAPCKYWLKGAICKNGVECTWSHVTKCEDQRKRVTNYKTKPCVDPGRGIKCEYGDRCNFSHPGEALRRPMPIEYTDKQYFKLLLRDCPTNRFPFGIFV